MAIKRALTKQFWTDFSRDLKQLASVRHDPERPYFTTILIAGTVAFVMAAGALMGYVYSYNRLNLLEQNQRPRLNGQPPAVYAAMLAGALLGIAFPFLVYFIIEAGFRENIAFFQFVTVFSSWLFFNFILSLGTLSVFKNWRNGVDRYLYETMRFGTARFAFDSELQPFRYSGSWIGENLRYDKEGHTLTVAGTRGGKGVNIILPNLLGMGTFDGSYVIIDPKGENAAVSARAQQRRGQNVILLNPWELLGEEYEKLGLHSATYNPLDILKIDRLNLSDDVEMIAECIVPMNPAKDDHFDNRARAIISGLLLHLVTEGEPEIQHLGTLWEWLRLPDEQWKNLLTTMSENQSFVGEIVRATAYEIITLKEQGSREYASVMSTAQKRTNFLRSPALRKSLLPSPDGLKSSALAEGKTTVYVIIPADRLLTHSQWLRLVSCCLMRSIIRKPDRDVTFILDEFYALGYLSEIVIGLGSYASYGIRLHMILQNLVQLADTYGNNWENFISSCSVRQFFNISDATTGNYVSAMLGTLSQPTFDQLGNISGATGRSLVNADELRQSSNEFIYLIVEDVPPARIRKMPYYDILSPDQYDPNPYYMRKKRPKA